MRFDNYETFIQKYPYISFLTGNIAPVFSDLLGRFVSSVENLFGTSQKTDTTAQNTLSDLPNTSASASLEDRGVQSPPTNATPTIPASTSSTIQPQTQSKATNSNKVSNDDDDNPLDIDVSQSPTNATQTVPASTSRNIQAQSTATNTNKVSNDDDDSIYIDESQSATNATQTVPASTTRTIQTQTMATNSNKVSNDDDASININQLQPQPTAVPGDKYNLFRSFAASLNVADFNEIKRTLVEKGNEMLESIRGDLDEYYNTTKLIFYYQTDTQYSSRPTPLRRRDRLERDLYNMHYNEIKGQRDTLRKFIREPLFAHLAMEDDEKRAGQLDQIILEYQRLENLLKPFELLKAIFKWYDGCSDKEEKDLALKLEDKWDVEFRRSKSFTPRFNKTYAPCLSMFSEGILPDYDHGQFFSADKDALLALALTHDVTIKLHESDRDDVWTEGNGKEEVHLYEKGGYYSPTPFKDNE